MSWWLSTLVHRPAVRPGPLLHRRPEPTSTKNGQFLSYLAQSGFRRVNPDRYEVSMRRRRVALAVAFWSVVAGFAWIVIESAQALSIF
jgi:hypothetical protein